MKYQLKLNKTKMYQIVNYCAEGYVVLPFKSKCQFKKYDGSYWLRFTDEFDYWNWRVTVMLFCGKTSVLFHCYDTGYEKMFHMDPQWLLDNQMLEEVA